MKDAAESIYKVFRNIILEAKYGWFGFVIQYIYIDRGSCLNYAYLLVVCYLF